MRLLKLIEKLEEPTFWSLSAEPVPVFAIVGWRQGDDVRILGTGVLIGARHVLTAGHVVQRRSIEDRKARLEYRVYSPWIGIKTVSKVYRKDSDLAVVELRSQVPTGLAPVAVSSEDPAIGSRAWAFGYGGDQTGLLQIIPTRIARCAATGGAVCLTSSSALGPRDSGAPILVETGGEVMASGIYIGLRNRPDAAGAPDFERFAIGLGAHLDDIGSLSVSRQPVDRFLERLVIDPGPDSKLDPRLYPTTPDPWPDTELDPRQYSIGIGETNAHDFLIGTGDGMELIVTVNATAMPLRSRPRMTVRLFHEGRFVGRRAYPGPLQTFRLDGRYAAGFAGRWTFEVESESEITYQAAATLYKR